MYTISSRIVRLRDENATVAGASAGAGALDVVFVVDIGERDLSRKSTSFYRRMMSISAHLMKAASAYANINDGLETTVDIG